MGKAKKGNPEGVSKFDGFGVDFKCKLIGFTTVEAARGDDICQAAINKLKTQALRNNKEKKEHKQRITANITLKGIRLLDESTERIDHAHPIHRISFISHDNDDKRTFSYIVGTKEGYKLFAIKSMKEAEQITKTLKELFQEVFEMYQAKKNDAGKESDAGQLTEKAHEAKEEARPPIKAPVEKQTNETSDILNLNEEATYQVPSEAMMDWGQLNEQIQVMQSDAIPSSTSFDLLAGFGTSAPTSAASDPFEGDNFASNVSSKQADVNPFDDMYATVNKKQPDSSMDFFTSPSAPTKNKASTMEEKETDAPLLMNDPFAELKKNINEMHKQNQMQTNQQQQHQQTFGFTGAYQTQPVNNMGYMTQSNPFVGQQQFTNQNGMQQPNSGYQQPAIPPRPAVVSNPFIQTSVAPSVTPQDNLGWTVNSPTAAPRKEVAPIMNGGSDPFAFLNNQTGGQNDGISSSNQSYNTTSNSASGELLDFLG